MENWKDIKLFRSCFYTLLVCLSVIQYHTQALNLVENFDVNLNDVSRVENTFFDLNNIHIRYRREATSADEKCKKQETTFLSEIYNHETNDTDTRLETKWSFVNESNLNLALAWAGTDNDGVLIAVTAEDSFTHVSSNLWRSEDFGRHWKNLNDDIEKGVIRKGDGVQRNPHNPKKIYLLTYHEYIFVTEDGGKTWTKRKITIDGDIPREMVFHTSKDKEDYILTITDKHNLYVTTNNWRDPKPVQSEIHSSISSALWATEESKHPDSVFCLIGKGSTNSIQDFINSFLRDKYQQEFRLCRHDVKGTDMTTVLTKVASFGIQGKFLYASVFKEALAEQNAPRVMKVSTDAGSSWSEAQLPTLTGDRFYSVLDMSEDLIFMHVDNPGDTGHGTLFTSAGEGIIYSESLERHLYPNFGHGVTDFYKVESIRGVYLASQIDSDDSIHTMITYDRGGIWQRIKAPAGMECDDKMKGCFLQIHNKYSIARGIKAKAPLSIPDALGLILVHGHIADALQTTEPDIFLTSDGGYIWKKVLDGPHHYQIANSGGLIVAVSTATATPNTIKFSTDEGQCWHEYQYTDEEINLTGLLTEPGGKSLTVSLWGYHKETHKWIVNVIDFADVIKTKCKNSDFTQWVAHETLRKEENKDVEGCLLGKKEIFKKLKADSWCSTPYSYTPIKNSKACTCTREDYECEYGFERPAGSDLCKMSPKFHGELDICNKEDVIKLITNGYRKIPGDVCIGGFQSKDQKLDLMKHCNEGKKDLVKQEEGITDETSENSNPLKDSKTSGIHSTLVTVIVIIVLITIVTMSSFFLYKLYLLRKHKVVYRYSLLAQNQNENQEFDANLEGVLTNTDSLYNDDSDEEQDTAKSNGNPFEITKPRNANGKPTVKSYHDDSDDDLLN